MEYMWQIKNVHFNCTVTGNNTIRHHLKHGAVPSQNLPVRLFDKDQPSTSIRKERQLRRESLAAEQAEESEWLHSLWGSDIIELMTTRTSSPNVMTEDCEESEPAVHQPTGKLVA